MIYCTSEAAGREKLLPGSMDGKTAEAENENVLSDPGIPDTL